MSKEQLKTFRIQWYEQVSKTMTDERKYREELSKIYPGISTPMLIDMGVLHYCK